MAKIVIIGGSVSGLATALALSRQGHEIHILERDAAAPPDDVEKAHHEWTRATVPQTTHSHAFGSLGVNLLRDRAPEVYRALVEAGADEINLGDRKPPTLTDAAPDPGDAELNMLGCRRTTFELVLRREVLAGTGAQFHQGVTVRGLEMETGGDHPQVVGVRTGDGETILADIVVDASGRRSQVGSWLTAQGVRVADDQSSSCNITYYTRFYRRLRPGPPPGPLNRGFGAGGLWDHYTGVMFLGDNNTFSVSLGVLPDDILMKGLRQEPVFTAAVRATPILAPWIDPQLAEPISGVHAMGGLDNSLRGLATTRQQPVLGLFAIGDSAGSTNPAYGRGVSLALAHAYKLADVLDAHPKVSEEQSQEMALQTERLLVPWFTEAVRNDTGRGMLWRATVEGTEPPRPPGPPPGPGGGPQGPSGPQGPPVNFGTAAMAAGVDPVVWRALVRVMMTISPPDSVYSDPEIARRVGAVLRAGAPPNFPAPSRMELARIVTAAATA